MSENLLAGLIIAIYFSPVIYQGFIVLKEFKGGNKIPLRNFFKFLKISMVALLISAGVFFTLNHTNYLNYEKPISYSKIGDISFENFKGLEFFRKSLYGNERFAYIVTSIDEKIGEDYVIVEAFFHPSRSFVYNSHSQNADLLRHELYHFKITELYVRRAKQKIAKLDDFSRNKIISIIAETRSEKNDFQRKYDYDTFHSYVLKEQKNYEKRIDSLLNLLVKFNQPKIILNEEY